MAYGIEAGQLHDYLQRDCAHSDQFNGTGTPAVKVYCAAGSRHGTAVWDAGYSGVSQSLMIIYNANGFRGGRKIARVAQLVFMTLSTETEDMPESTRTKISGQKINQDSNFSSQHFYISSNSKVKDRYGKISSRPVY